MAKKKKTREEKILADSRHFTYHLETTAPQVSLPTVKNSPIAAPPVRIGVIQNYDFVINDIKKTALITGIIVSFQIILYIFLNRI